jgi:hypothetical protein
VGAEGREEDGDGEEGTGGEEKEGEEEEEIELASEEDILLEGAGDSRGRFAASLCAVCVEDCGLGTGRRNASAIGRLSG